MILIPIIIIVIIIIIDLYLTFNKRFKEQFENKIINKEIIFDIPNPWNKIIYDDKINKYYIYIKNITNYINKFMEWLNIPYLKDNIIDINIDNNTLIIKTESEEEALVIANLIISNFNNELSLDEIKSRDLIVSTVIKAKKYKVISTKLIELIKYGLQKLNEPILNDNDNNIDFHLKEDKLTPIVTKYEDGTPVINEPLVNNVIKDNISLNKILPESKVMPYGGSEYATINF